MEFLNYPINRDAQMKKIIEDTEEIINTFRQISSVIVENIDNSSEKTMYNLGQKLINYKEEQENLESGLGGCQINII